MLTKYEIIGTDSIARVLECELPREPSFQELKAIVEPNIQTEGKSQAYMEHVRVWHDNQYCSMFVDDMGALKRLPVNEAATLIYHANMFEHEPESFDAVNAPKIHGPAVLFYRNVWF